MRDWRAHGTLGSAFVAAKKAQVGTGFDYIVCLEANRKTAARTCVAAPEMAS